MSSNKIQYYYRLTKLDNISRLYKINYAYQGNQHYVYRHLNGKGAWAKIDYQPIDKESVFQPISEARARLIIKMGMD